MNKAELAKLKKEWFEEGRKSVFKEIRAKKRIKDKILKEAVKEITERIKKKPGGWKKLSRKEWYKRNKEYISKWGKK